MQRRNLNSDFVGGAYVFPGGAVDPSDREADLGPYCSGRTDAGASRLLSLSTGGLAYWVAAVRECFEEAGVLLAYDRDGRILALGEKEVGERFAGYRDSLNEGEDTLIAICAREGLVLAADRMHYFSHWITPVGAPRRYDTRFFVSQAPPDQVPLEDNRETVASVWVRPPDALERYEHGEMDLIFPTIRNLEAIGRFDRSADLLTAAAAIESVPTILPRLVPDGNGMRIVLPGDPLYDAGGGGGGPARGHADARRPGGPTLGG